MKAKTQRLLYISNEIHILLNESLLLTGDLSSCLDFTAEERSIMFKLQLVANKISESETDTDEDS